MKRYICLLMLLPVFGLSAQKSPVYTVKGDLVQVTSYYDTGEIKEQGFYKDKKLAGEWVLFDKEGNKVVVAQYKNGQKVGKWFFWDKEVLKEVNYKNSKIASVNSWKKGSRVVVN